MFKNIKEYLESKKNKTFMFTTTVNIIIAALGVPMVELLIPIISGLGGVTIFGQALSDGLSKGVTSSTKNKISSSE